MMKKTLFPVLMCFSPDGCLITSFKDYKIIRSEPMFQNLTQPFLKNNTFLKGFRITINRYGQRWINSHSKGDTADFTKGGTRFVCLLIPAKNWN
jgi:hypothetical protein